ncbi:YecA family protein [Peribacillus deserti]|uniref:Zinc chelation protein SecC n=1 Tax=Peribacillus deserti TaxID=673318 RepID=A0A2N5MBC2_9BACI|nr:SEC-C metal-binding domain-containing protein [Peribacillus deserti]PLT31646.1 zinc chelation protein SecC [Peribacillus deserti]
MDKKTRKAKPARIELGKAHYRQLEENNEQRIMRRIDLPYKLLDVLSTLTKAELDNIRKALDLRGISALKKDELILELVRSIPAQFEKIIGRFDKERYALLQKLVKNFGKTRLPKEFSMEKIRCWMNWGIAFPVINEGERLLTMPNELVDLFLEVDNVELQRTINRNTEWVNLTNGLLYYNGIMSTSNILEKISELTRQKIDSIDFLNVFFNASDYYHQTTFSAYGLTDQRVHDAKFTWEEQKKRPSIDFFPFTKKQLLLAGKPGYVDKSPQMNSFLQFLNQYYDLTPIDRDDIAHELIVIINTHDHLNVAIKYLQSKLEFPNFEFVQQLTAHLTEVFNHTRRWMLKGHTPREISQARKPETIMSARPAAKNFPKSNVIDFNSRKTVSRNDPCSCGSGKKYKKCCGRLK